MDSVYLYSFTFGYILIEFIKVSTYRFTIVYEYIGRFRSPRNSKFNAAVCEAVLGGRSEKRSYRSSNAHNFVSIRSITDDACARRFNIQVQKRIENPVYINGKHVLSRYSDLIFTQEARLLLWISTLISYTTYVLPAKYPLNGLPVQVQYLDKIVDPLAGLIDGSVRIK